MADTHFYTAIDPDLTAMFPKDLFYVPGERQIDGDIAITYSGIDMRVVAFPTYESGRRAIEKPVVLTSLNGISVSEHRDKFPVRRLGTSNPAGFVKGNRTIAGTLIFCQLGEYGLREILARFTNLTLKTLDELPPLDLVVTFVNEQGDTSYFGLTGLEILDEGESFTLDDMEWYTTASYMAMAKIPMQPVVSYQGSKFARWPHLKPGPVDSLSQLTDEPDEVYEGGWDFERGIA